MERETSALQLAEQKRGPLELASLNSVTPWFMLKYLLLCS